MKIVLDTHADDSTAEEVATISNKALTSNVATLTTAAAHGLATGDRVVVDCSDNVFDGGFIVASTPSGTTFTYALTHANVTSAAATGSVSKVPTHVALGVGGRRGRKILLLNAGPGDITYDFTEPDDILTDLADQGFPLVADAEKVVDLDDELYLSTDTADTELRYAVVSG